MTTDQRGVLIRAHGEDAYGLITALRVARQAALEPEPGARFDVVVQGPLVRLLTAGSAAADDVVATTISSLVTVTVCRNSMQRAGITDDQLLAGTTRSRPRVPTSQPASGRAGPTCATERTGAPPGAVLCVRSREGYLVARGSRFTPGGR